MLIKKKNFLYYFNTFLENIIAFGRTEETNMDIFIVLHRRPGFKVIFLKHSKYV